MRNTIADRDVCVAFCAPANHDNTKPRCRTAGTPLSYFDVLFRFDDQGREVSHISQASCRGPLRKVHTGQPHSALPPAATKASTRAISWVSRSSCSSTLRILRALRDGQRTRRRGEWDERRTQWQENRRFLKKKGSLCQIRILFKQQQCLEKGSVGGW